MPKLLNVIASVFHHETSASGSSMQAAQSQKKLHSPDEARHQPTTEVTLEKRSSKLHFLDALKSGQDPESSHMGILDIYLSAIDTTTKYRGQSLAADNFLSEACEHLAGHLTNYNALIADKRYSSSFDLGRTLRLEPFLQMVEDIGECLAQEIVSSPESSVSSLTGSNNGSSGKYDQIIRVSSLSDSSFTRLSRRSESPGVAFNATLVRKVHDIIARTLNSKEAVDLANRVKDLLNNVGSLKTSEVRWSQIKQPQLRRRKTNILMLRKIEHTFAYLRLCQSVLQLLSICGSEAFQARLSAEDQYDCTWKKDLEAAIWHQTLRMDYILSAFGSVLKRAVSHVQEMTENRLTRDSMIKMCPDADLDDASLFIAPIDSEDLDKCADGKVLKDLFEKLDPTQLVNVAQTFTDYIAPIAMATRK